MEMKLIRTYDGNVMKKLGRYKRIYRDCKTEELYFKWNGSKIFLNEVLLIPGYTEQYTDKYNKIHMMIGNVTLSSLLYKVMVELCSDDYGNHCVQLYTYVEK